MLRKVFPSATALFVLAKHSPASAAVAVRSLPTDCKALVSTSAPLRKEEQQGAGSEPGHPSPQEQAQEMSKAFLTSVLDMEELWIKGLAGQLRYWNAAKKMPLQEPQQAELLERVRSDYLDTMRRAAAGRVLSIRGRAHLKQACLAAATHRVITQDWPDMEAAVDEFVGFSMGGLYAGFMLGGLKLSAWIKRLLLRESSISQAVDTLHTVARDMEGACHCSVQPLSAVSDSDVDAARAETSGRATSPSGGTPGAEEQQQEDPEAAAESEARTHHTAAHWAAGAALTVDSCMLADVLRSEGAPQLLRYFCCTHNVRWLEAYRGDRKSVV